MQQQKIDTEALNEIKDMLEDEFSELVNTYTRDTETKLSKLEAEIESANHDAVRKLAHSMKGASVNLGMIYYGELCHQLEEDAKVENTVTYSEHFQKMKAEKIEVFQELERLLN